MTEYPAIQDVFCGVETIVHVRRGRAAPSTDEIANALTRLEVECGDVRRDDTATL